MIISELSVRRPVFATVLSLLLVILGVMSFERLAVREYPDIDAPVVAISTGYRGASAAVVETKVTQILEDAVAGIEGLRTLESESEDERSRIVMIFDLDRDVDAAANDVRDRISRVVGRLPEEADTPLISKQDSEAEPVLWLNLSSDRMSVLELTDYADRVIIDRLSVVDGVAQVTIGGERRYAMRIWLDRRALAARGLTVEDVENALRQENVELPAGRIESEQREFSIRTQTGLQTEQDFRELVVGRGADGYFVRLGEIADVRLDAETYRTLARANGEPGISLGIVQLSKANTVATASGVKEAVAALRPTLPEGMDLQVNLDRSAFIEQSMREVFKTIAVALTLVLIVIFAFLGTARATLIPAVVIPVSLIASFTVLYAFGFSINTLTLLGLVLAIGLVVDDAIVVLENIFRRIEGDEPKLLASIRGSREIGFAVIATTLVLVAVFVPLSFMEGNIGRLFSEFGIALAASVVFSSLVALTLVPMMASKLLHRHALRGGFTAKLDHFFQGLADRYRRLLRRIIAAPWVVAAATAATAIVAVGFFRALPQEYAPVEDRGIVFTRIQGPEGASFEYMLPYVEQLEEIGLRIVEEGDGRRLVVRLPASFGGGTGEVNSAFSFFLLEDWGKRERSSVEIAEEMRAATADWPGVQVRVIAPQGLGVRGSGRPIQIVLGGASYDEINGWTQTLIERMNENPGIVGPVSDYYERKPQFRVAVDRDRAADLGVSLATIGRTLETTLGSRLVTTFIRGGQEYNVILQSRGADRASPRDLTNTYVRSATTGELVPLSNLIGLNEVASAAELNRFDRLRAIKISAGLAPGYSLGEALDWVEETVRAELPTSAVLMYDGESREYKESAGSLYVTFALAIVIVFLVLAAQFESFRHPLIILTTVPLAVSGGLFGLWITGESINVFSQIGAVMLVGLAAKNGVLIVEFANQLRDRGQEFIDAIVNAAAIRLRPVLMTSMCTAFGAVPLLLATGAGSESRQAIGIVIFFGVTISVVLTLFVVPAFYALIAKGSRSPDHVSRRIRELEEAAAPGA